MSFINNFTAKSTYKCPIPKVKIPTSRKGVANINCKTIPPQGTLKTQVFIERGLNSRSLSIIAISPVRLSSVCSCTLLYRLKFSAIFLRYLVPWPSVDIHTKFYGDRPRGTPPLKGAVLNAKGPAKYSDFGELGGHILKTVQDRR